MDATIKGYEKFVARNALGGQRDLLKRSFYLMIEAGEFCNEVKKHVEKGDGVNNERHKQMVEELGDTLYYFFLCMSSLGITLQDVIEANIVKLEQRHVEQQRVNEAAARLRAEFGGYSPVPDVPSTYQI